MCGYVHIFVLMCGVCFHAWTCVYVGIMNGSAIICLHTHFYSPLLLCVLRTMCTTLQWVSITAHISTDTLPVDPILQQVLRVVCAYNALYCKGKYTGSGRVGRVGWSAPMLNSPQHTLELCTMLSHAEMPEHCLIPSPSYFVCVHGACACKFVTHACVKLHGCSVSMRVYICVVKYIYILCSGMCLC